MGEPVTQGDVGVEHLLLMQRMLVVAGDMQRPDQLATITLEQAVAAHDPFWQSPALGQFDAQLDQGDAEQLFLDCSGLFALEQYALLPGLEQLRMGAQQWPDG